MKTKRIRKLILRVIYTLSFLSSQSILSQSSKIFAIDISPGRVILDSISTQNHSIKQADTLKFKFDAYNSFSHVFDSRHLQYILECDTALIVLNSNGALVKTIHKTGDLEGMVYDPVNDRIYCALWRFNSYFFTELDLQTGSFKTIRSLSDISVHSATIDYDGRYYYIISDTRGLLKVNMLTGVKVDSVKYFTTNNCRCNAFDIESGRIATTCVQNGQYVMQLYNPSDKSLQTLDTLAKYGTGFFSYESAAFDQNNGNWYMNLGKKIGIKNIRTNSALDTFSIPYNRIRSLSLAEPLCFRPLVPGVCQKQSPACYNSMNGNISIQLSGGRKPFFYSLDGINYDTNSMFKNLKSGNYLISVKDKFGFCDVKILSELTHPDSFQIKKYIANNHCYGLKEGEVALNVFGGSPPYSFSLNSSSFQPDSVFKGLASGNYVITLKDAHGCMDSIRDIQINAPDQFKIPSVNDTTLCNGQRVLINIHHPRAMTYHVKSNTGLQFVKDFLLLDQSATYYLEVKDSNGCEGRDTFTINKYNFNVAHDFLMPAMAFLTDTVYAVNISRPIADNSNWTIDKVSAGQFPRDPFTLGMLFKDTGLYQIGLQSRYKACGYKVIKQLKILSNKDSLMADPKFGYAGSMIKKFEVYPNPHDGQHFNINIELRDNADCNVYKIDASTGYINGEMHFTNLKSQLFTAFNSSKSEIYYLKLVAGRESRVIKVVVVQ